MDLESGRGPLVRTPAAAAYRALVGASKLLYNTAKSPAAGIFAAKLGKRAYDYMGSRKRQRTNGSSRVKTKSRASPLTTQKDISVTRPSADKSKSFRRFQKKVRLALQAEQPRQIYTKGFKEDLNSSTNALQSIGGTYWGDNNCTGSGDLFQIFKTAFAVTTAVECEQYKIHLGSMGIKLQIKNEYDGVAFVDLYMCTARKAQVAQSAPKTAWDAYFADMVSVGSTFSAWDSMTPYHNANWCRHWKIKKKWSVKLAAFDTFAIEQGRRVNRIIQGRQIQDQGISPGQIMFIYFVRGGPASQPLSNNPSGISPNSIRVSAQKTFFFREVAGANQKDEIDMTDV